jgi:hypothetical protein
MMTSKPLTWLCEEPRHSLIANRIFRKGWPELASFFFAEAECLLPGVDGLMDAEPARQNA